MRLRLRMARDLTPDPQNDLHSTIFIQISQPCLESAINRADQITLRAWKPEEASICAPSLSWVVVPL